MIAANGAVVPDSGAFPTARAFDVRCYVGSVGDAADRVVERALSAAGGWAVSCNVHVLMTADRDAAVRSALDGAWVVFPDGAPVAWLLRRSGAPGARRVGGPDLMVETLDRGRASGLRHCLFGSTPQVLEQLVAALRSRLPGVEIVKAFAPAWGEEESSDSLAEIQRARPHVVWVALGAPKQEKWMLRHAPTLAPAVVLGVGAAFDFHAGVKPRAPRWMQQASLEWLYRLGSEPRRLAVRYLTSNSRFLARAALQLASPRRRLRP